MIVDPRRAGTASGHGSEKLAEDPLESGNSAPQSRGPREQIAAPREAWYI